MQKISDLAPELRDCKLHWYRSNLEDTKKLIYHFDELLDEPHILADEFLLFASHDYYEHLLLLLQKTKESVDEYLAFTPDKKGKLAMIANKFPELDQQYRSNKFSGILTPNNFLEDLKHRRFFYNIFIMIRSRAEEKIKKFGEDHFNYSEVFYPLLEELFNLTKTLLEVQVLQFYHHSISSEQEPSTPENYVPNFKENKYPKVFHSGYGFELFKFLIQKEDEKITRTWARKYFELFKDEKLIKQTARNKNFLIFLKEEFNIKLKELDSRTTFGNPEIRFFIDLKKDFKILHDLDNSTPIG